MKEFYKKSIEHQDGLQKSCNCQDKPPIDTIKFLKPDDLLPTWYSTHLWFGNEYKKYNPPIDPQFNFDNFITPLPEITRDGFQYDKDCLKIYLLKKIKRVKMYSLSKEKWRYFILDHEK